MLFNCAYWCSLFIVFYYLFFHPLIWSYVPFMNGSKMIRILLYKWTPVTYIIYASICLSVNLTLFMLQRNLFALHIYIYVLHIYAFYICACVYPRWHSHNTVFKMKYTTFYYFNITVNYVFIFFFIPQGKTICWVALTVYTDTEVVFLFWLFQLYIFIFL